MSQTFVFVGVPRIGNELASNLLEAGFKAAPDIAQADVVFTFTPFANDTEEVYFGSEGLITSAKAGAILINLAATTVSLTKEIAALAQVGNLIAVDAPLVVNDYVKERAYSDLSNLSVLVGASEQDFEATKEILSSFASRVIHCGEPGSGQLAKAVATIQNVAAMVSLIESDALCRAVGERSLEIDPILHAFDSNGTNPSLASLYKAIEEHTLSGSYSAEVMLGEVNAALSSAEEANLIMPHAEAAEHLIQLLFTIGGSKKTPAALSLLYADEEACAEQGLDWSLADRLYDAYESFEHFDEFDDCDCGHDHHHHHDHGHGFFGDYSSN